MSINVQAFARRVTRRRRPIVAPLLLLSALGCGGGNPKDAPSSPVGAWVLAETDAVCAPGVTGGQDPVESVTMAVDEEGLELDVTPCFGLQSGAFIEGDAGFVAPSLENEYGETAWMTCRGDGPNTYVCEHDWLDGELVLERL